MSSNPRDGDASLEKARLAYLDWGFNLDEQRRTAEHFQKYVGVVKAVYNRLPFDAERPRNDPGALYEYDEYLQRYDDEAASILRKPIRSRALGQDDIRALRAQEVVREAFFYAYKQHWGFQAIGRPPELQQLIAATCNDVFTIYAAGYSDPVASHSAQLLRQLCPQLQVNLLADVATGILCPRCVTTCRTL